jgi:hypothetical protein
MMSIQELLPHIELLESEERLQVGAPPEAYSLVAVGALDHDPDRRWSPFARLIRVAWVSTSRAERSKVVFGSEPILVAPGEDREAARMAFSIQRAGELAEAHPPGTVALLGGPLPSLDAASDTMINLLLEALGRARSAGATLMAYVPHPCPSLFEGWLRPGERTPWTRSSGLFWCYAHVGATVLRLEAYEIAPDQHDRAVAIALAHCRNGLPHLPRWTEALPEPLVS